MNTRLFEQVVSQLAEVFRRLSENPEAFHHSHQLEECRLYCPVTRIPQKPVRRTPGHHFQR
ncbi:MULTISPECIES: hypothetical protein [Gammaproteobacteria]|uniref:hypothetical protein n=1 Tax=Gammaproteobacteria TaxID=1236 RepID=UPI001AD9F02F|nr:MULTISPECIES: hypothetical protein [Gammaproteobacteria]MBO9482441.1 hypothetical protein [Salinisphaera sp. G21_0]MBO9493026.1 hypothetical protein [Thalassotalea sp. G20_0]